MHKVIVSLTSFPAAISYATQAVKSILAGSVLPDKIVLYLTLSQFDGIGLPEDLTNLEKNNPIFEILQDFPDATIVTIDDDVYYHKNMLRDILLLHEQYPKAVLAHRAKLMKPDKPYREWKKYRWYHFIFKRINSSFLNIQTGVGGVLYPPHSLKKELLDVSIFTKIAPTTDDIWFWAAAVANDTPIIPVPFGHNKPRGLKKPRELSLKTVNFKSGIDNNSAALCAILEHFPEIKKKISTGK